MCQLPARDGCSGEREQMGVCSPGHRSRPTGCHREEDFTSKEGRPFCQALLFLQWGVGCGERAVPPVTGGNPDTTRGHGGPRSTCTKTLVPWDTLGEKCPEVK